MADSNYLFSLSPEIINVGLGTSLAVFVGSTSNQTNVRIKYVSGGTLTILEALSGSTMASATLVARSATFAFLVDATGSMVFEGPASFYLAATGATCVVNILRGKNAGG